MDTKFALDLTEARPLLRRLSRRFTQNAEECSDLVQETLLKALTYREKFRQDTNFNGWLYTIMRNTFINQYRRKQRYFPLTDSARESYFLNVEDNHTFSSPERKYAWEDLWRNIDELKEELRTPFKLHTSGYKYHEIAQSLNIPIGTVKNRIFHARQLLQEKLV